MRTSGWKFITAAAASDSIYTFYTYKRRVYSILRLIEYRNNSDRLGLSTKFHVYSYKNYKHTIVDYVRDHCAEAGYAVVLT